MFTRTHSCRFKHVSALLVLFYLSAKLTEMWRWSVQNVATMLWRRKPSSAASVAVGSPPQLSTRRVGSSIRMLIPYCLLNCWSHLWVLTWCAGINHFESWLTEFLHIVDKSDEPRSLVAGPGGTREKTKEGKKKNPSLDNNESKSPKRPNDGSISISKKVGGVFFLFVFFWLITYWLLGLIISDLKHSWFTASSKKPFVHLCGFLFIFSIILTYLS